MKKIIAVMCSAVMTMSLAVPAMAAAGSITSPATSITATTEAGDELVSSAVSELTAEDIKEIVTNADVLSIVNKYLDEKADEAYDMIKDYALELFGEESITTVSGTEINLDDYEPVDLLALIDDESLGLDFTSEKVEVATDFEMSEDKTIDDYIVCAINPFDKDDYSNEDTDDDISDQIAFIEPELNEDDEFSYEITFYPLLVQILETK